ncbi:YqeB family protein [Streptomyces cacaoi]|uniref:YqeB family protein n=1 Tax=Streptomyces cacaoi TaxID=1898 RepID=UPI0037481ED3
MERESGAGRKAHGPRDAIGADGADGADGGRETVVAQGAWFVPVFTVAGGAAGFLAKLLAQWLVTLPWAPLKGPAELLSSAPEPWRTLGAVALGAVAGLVLALIGLHESLTVRVRDDAVALTVEDEHRTVPRDRIALAFLDGKQLVLQAPDGSEPAREKCDLDAGRLARAFAAHGYRWADEDPHGDAFRRWVPGTPGLPPGADALLRARARALEQSGGAGDVRELREELGRSGVVVRDTKKRQYWRLAPPVE